MSSLGSPVPPNRRIARFGVFEFELDQMKLTRNGRDVQLQQQPGMVLAQLLQRSGQVVTREELRSAIWPSGTYVEFDFSLNTAINRLRRALGDSASEPRYIETVPKQGYRFVAPLELVLPVPGPPSQAQESEPRPARTIPDRYWQVISLSSAAVVLVLAGLYLWSSRSPDPMEGPVIRYSMPADGIEQVETVTISPRGDQVVYSGRHSGKSLLYRRFLDEEASRPIAGSEEAVQPFFSPDGKEVGFFVGGSIRVAGPSGVRNVVSMAPESDPRKAFWAEDGRIYFTATKDKVAGVWRIRATGKALELVLRSSIHEKGSTVYFGQQLLNVERPLMLYSSNSGPVQRSIGWLEIPGESGTVVDRAMGGQVLPTGHLLYYWQGGLFAARFDARIRTLTGSPLKVLGSVAADGWRGPNAGVSETGTLVYLKHQVPHRRILWVSRNGRTIPLPLEPAAYEHVEVSPDGSKLAIARQDGSDLWTLWVYDLRSGAWTQLAQTAVPKPRAVWAPDSKSLVASLAQSGAEFVNMYRISLAAPQNPERLIEQPDVGQFPQSWSAAADAILYQEGTRPDTQSDILVLPLAGDKRPRRLVATAGVDRSPAFSPDGRWFAYASGQQNALEVFIQPFAQTSPARQVSKGGGSDPVWSPDGRRLYYLGPGASLMEVAIDGNAIAGTPTQVVPGNFTITTDWWTRSFSIAPDGRFLVIRSVPDERSTVPQIHVIVNWFKELARLSPLP